MRRIETASLDEVFEVVLDPEVFPDDGEFQTVFGLYKYELESLRGLADRNDIALTVDLDKLRLRMIGMLMGFPHGCDSLIAKRYGFDVSFR